MKIGPARIGRFSPKQAARFRAGLVRGCGYFAIGPVAVLVNLPRRFEKADPELSLFDFNAHLRRIAQASVDLHED